MTHEVTRIEDSVYIEAPPESVWHVTTDPRLSPQWNANIVAIRDVSGVPVETGSSWVQVVRILGKSTDMRAVVTECHPPNGGTVQFSGPGEPLVTSKIEAEGSGSRLTQIMEITIPGGLGGMAMRIAIPTIERELRHALESQKKAVEAGTFA